MFVPNGPLANSVIRNYTDIGSRRAQYYIRIPFEADIQQAREVILEVLSSDKRVLRDPEPEVMVEKLDENAVVLIARSWIDRPNYWGAYYENFEHIKIALDKAGLQAPYPQTEMWIMGDRDKNSPDNT